MVEGLAELDPAIQALMVVVVASSREGVEVALPYPTRVLFWLWDV